MESDRVGARILKFRETQGVTLEELAARPGLGVSQVVSMESGSAIPAIGELARIDRHSTRDLPGRSGIARPLHHAGRRATDAWRSRVAADRSIRRREALNTIVPHVPIPRKREGGQTYGAFPC